MALFVVCCSTGAQAYERCYVETSSKESLTCFISAWNVTYQCNGNLIKGGEVLCHTNDKQTIDCITKEVSLRGPKDLWCNSPPVEQSANAQFTVVNGPVTRSVLDAPTPEKKPEMPAARVSQEDCDSYITADPSSWDWMFQSKLQRRCLRRKASNVFIPQKEDCNVIMHSPDSSWSRLFEETRRQSCFDRQSGIK